MEAGEAEECSVEKPVCLLLSGLNKDAMSASASQEPVTVYMCPVNILVKGIFALWPAL